MRTRVFFLALVAVFATFSAVASTSDVASWPEERWPGNDVASWPVERWPGTEVASWPIESWPGTEVASWPVV